MKRPNYHHGNLANALTAAATQLARDGGPDAVVLREAARQVGVSATAAYRHFASHGDLIHAVKGLAGSELAKSMRAELAKTPPEPEPASEAIRRVRALGMGYVRFALAEPGLFRTAFCRPIVHAPHDDEHDITTVEPYQMLVDAIDALVDSGLMPAQRRPLAEVFAWSAVHGLAMLLLDGPLVRCSPDEQEQAIDRILNGVADSLLAHQGPSTWDTPRPRGSAVPEVGTDAPES
jgi:AcrR family transcriptional regulator